MESKIKFYFKLRKKALLRLFMNTYFGEVVFLFVSLTIVKGSWFLRKIVELFLNNYFPYNEGSKDFNYIVNKRNKFL